MMPRLILDLLRLAGALAFLNTATAVQARQVEVVQFGAATDGIVSEVDGHPARAPETSTVSDEAPANLDQLRQDFAAMAQPGWSYPNGSAERSSYPIPH